MTKQTVSKREQIQSYTERERPFFISESGVKIKVRPLEMDAAKLMEDGLAADYRAAGEPIDAPEVNVEVAGGSTVKRILTEKNLVVADDDEETARRQALWLAHQDAVTRMKVELGQLTIEYLLGGIDEELPEDESWIQRYERLHIHVPADKYDRLVFYKKHVLIVTPGDLARMQAEVMLVSSSGTLERKEVEAQVASFLRQARVRVQKLDVGGASTEAAQRPVAS